MSRPNDLINEESGIINYLKKIRKLSYVIDLYLVGSRAKGTNRIDSDWDIYVYSKIPVINFGKVYGKKDGYNIDFSIKTEPPKKINIKL